MTCQWRLAPCSTRPGFWWSPAAPIFHGEVSKRSELLRLLATWNGQILSGLQQARPGPTCGQRPRPPSCSIAAAPPACRACQAALCCVCPPKGGGVGARLPEVPTFSNVTHRTGAQPSVPLPAGQELLELPALPVSPQQHLCRSPPSSPPPLLFAARVSLSLWREGTYHLA